MDPAGSAFEALHTWVNSLTSLQTLCIKSSFGAVNGATLNAFAQAKVVATVGATNLFNFGSLVHSRFPEFDPMNANQALGDQSIFRDLADMIGPNTLQYLVTSFVWEVLANLGNNPPHQTPLSQLFTAASWKNIITSIQNANLDAVIGEPNKVLGGLTSLYNNAARETFDSLTDYLCSIQPVN